MAKFKKSFFLIFAVNSIYFSAGAQAREITLQESFKLAVDRSATVAISNDQIDQAEAQIKQARSGYMPILSLQASTIQQAETTNPLAKGLSSTSQSKSSINLSQNLFQGFRDVSTVHQRDQIKRGNEWGKKQAFQQLYKDVALAFYSILIFRSDIVIYKEQIQSTQARRSELGSARKSGRARDSDIVISDSAVANLEAAISRTEGQMVGYQETFSFLTGLSSEVKLVNTTNLPKEFKNSEGWLKNSEFRPDIQKSKIDVSTAEEGIRVAQSGFYPSLGFSANYYLSRPSGLVQDADWDAGLVLSFPFFSGGLTKAQVSEATIIHHSKELNLRLNREMAAQTIKTIYAVVQSDFDQLDKLMNASLLSRRSYDLVRRDNRLGVATNMDVLTALQNWQETKRNLERLRITATYDYLRLLVESGKIDFESEIGENK